ncbi:MAG: YkgJ family cysteine cluster protein [Halodesulfurarchaeum sp.]
MEVNCEGCAGCCIDWRPLGAGAAHEHRGARKPLDDVYNLVPLSRDDVRAMLAAGYADAMTPRLWAAEGGPTVQIDGHAIAALEGKPVFFVGLRKVPKPVAPFDAAPRWLDTCIFLDPATLQCRIHGDEAYPEECAAYPGHNLAMGATAECERVEDVFGGTRLVDDEPPEEGDDLLLGPQAVGQKVFAYPDPDELRGVIDRAVRGALTREDRARFVAAAAASAPGSPTVAAERFEEAFESAMAADGWISEAIGEWRTRAGDRESADTGGERTEPDPALGTQVEDERGAPPTPGWD